MNRNQEVGRNSSSNQKRKLWILMHGNQIYRQQKKLEFRQLFIGMNIWEERYGYSKEKTIPINSDLGTLSMVQCVMINLLGYSLKIMSRRNGIKIK